MDYFVCSSLSQSCMWPRARSRSRRALLKFEPGIERIQDTLWRSSMRACCSAVGESCGGAPGPLPAPLPNSSCAATLFNCSPAICCLQAGNLSLRIQFAKARTQVSRSAYRSAAAPARPRPCARSASAADSLQLGVQLQRSNNGTLIENPVLKLFAGSGCVEVALDVVQQRGVAVVLGAKADFGQQPQMFLIAFATSLLWRCAIACADSIPGVGAGASSRVTRRESRECSRDRA